MSYKILLADDETQFYGACLEGHFTESKGFTFESVSTIEECREKIRRTTYDVVILDIDFGHQDADGFSLVPEVRTSLQSRELGGCEQPRGLPS